MDLCRRRRGVGDAAAGETLLALPDRASIADSTVKATASGGNTAVVGGDDLADAANPFWSETVQDELRLQAMPPQGLNEAERSSAVSGTGSESTELRPEVVRTGQIAEGEAAQQSGRGSTGNARTAQAFLGVHADPGKGSREGIPTTAAYVEANRARETNPAVETTTPQPAQPSERLGMRPGERLIVEQMRKTSLLIGLNKTGS